MDAYLDELEHRFNNGKNEFLVEDTLLISEDREVAIW
jgi:hypothetical protein